MRFAMSERNNIRIPKIKKAVRIKPTVNLRVVDIYSKRHISEIYMEAPTGNNLFLVVYM